MTSRGSERPRAHAHVALVVTVPALVVDAIHHIRLGILASGMIVLVFAVSEGEPNTLMLPRCLDVFIVLEILHVYRLDKFWHHGEDNPKRKP